MTSWKILAKTMNEKVQPVVNALFFFKKIEENISKKKIGDNLTELYCCLVHLSNLKLYVR